MKTIDIKREFLAPVLVLTAICLVISGALALTNMATEPVITAAAAARAEQARKEVLPEADGFTQLALSGLPESVTEAYQAGNGAGYVFMLSANGYGGEMEIICGMDGEGRITSTQLLDHAETQGMGAKAEEASYSGQYVGLDAAGLDGVDIISGATITSEAYEAAIGDAFAAYEMIKGG